MVLLADITTHLLMRTAEGAGAFHLSPRSTQAGVLGEQEGSVVLLLEGSDFSSLCLVSR